MIKSVLFMLCYENASAIKRRKALLARQTDMGKKLDQWDLRISLFMRHLGHVLERWALGILFIWFGLLKITGENSASSLIAKSIYFYEPEKMVMILGGWELLIGGALLVSKLTRLAVLLLMIRLPGTFLALVLKADLCFEGDFWVPTLQGQYLLKELTLIGAALVIGGTVRSETSPD